MTRTTQNRMRIQEGGCATRYVFQSTYFIMYLLTHHYHPRKRATYARFQGWRLFSNATTTTTLQSEPHTLKQGTFSIILFTYEPSLTTFFTNSTHHPQKRAYVLVFEGGCLPPHHHHLPLPSKRAFKLIFEGGCCLPHHHLPLP